MGFSFRRSVKLGKYAKINFSKSGTSLSFGPKGTKLNINKKGYRTTIGKGGFQYRKDHKWAKKNINQETIKKQGIEDIVKNMRQCDLERIKSPKILKQFGFASLIFLGLSSAFIPVLVIAFILGIITLFILLFNKQFKGGQYINKAIICWQMHDLEKSHFYCNKGLKLYDCETGYKLLELINQEVS